MINKELANFFIFIFYPPTALHIFVIPNYHAQYSNLGSSSRKSSKKLQIWETIYLQNLKFHKKMTIMKKLSQEKIKERIKLWLEQFRIEKTLKDRKISH